MNKVLFFESTAEHLEKQGLWEDAGRFRLAAEPNRHFLSLAAIAWKRRKMSQLKRRGSRGWANQSRRCQPEFPV